MFKKSFLLSTIIGVLSCALLQAQSLFSPITYIWQKDVVVTNTHCSHTKTCSLKKVRFLIRDYHFTIDGDDVHGSHLLAWYETDSLTSLEDYVFVQLVRGCIYTSTVENGEERFGLEFVQKIFGQSRPAIFTEWIIDSFDSDPVYNSIPGPPRHYLYRWNTPPYSALKTTEKFFGRERPKRAVLYISDMPSQGTYISNFHTAINPSFEYKIGLYRSKDVPSDTTAENTRFADPLVQFAWQNSWIYDHAVGKFEKRANISPICKVKVAT